MSSGEERPINSNASNDNMQVKLLCNSNNAGSLKVLFEVLNSMYRCLEKFRLELFCC